MITEIGIIAGEILNFLDKYRETDLKGLVRGLGKSKELILMSLGWLARNGHVVIKNDRGAYKISLREKEGL